jgi:hypothetical protein
VVWQQLMEQWVCTLIAVAVAISFQLQQVLRL